MDNINDIVSSVMGRMSSAKASTKEIQEAWERIAGDKESRVSDCKEGCITITATSSMRLVKFNLNRDKILKELQKEFPFIAKIIFKVGKC